MSKELVYRLLLERSGQYLSGEEISKQLGISRAAVWKAVDGLRKAGYTIDARSGLGYALTELPDALTEREIGRQLEALGSKRPAPLYLEEVDSTNSYLKRVALEGAPHGFAVVADCQTAGRGRSGRTFLSPKGKGVFLSILLRPTLMPQDLLPVTALSAVAMCDAVERTCGLRPRIKWTNDLILNGKKLAGILTEMALEGETGMVQSLVIGAGINVHHTAQDFTPEVAALATSIQAETGKAISRSRLAAEMLLALDQLGESLGGDLSGYLAAYRRDCITIGRQVQLLWRENRETVEAVDVDEQFGLVVRHADGRMEVIRSGEVSVRGLAGYVE